MSGPPGSSQAFIADLIRTAGTSDPIEAVQSHARELVGLYTEMFGNPTMPLNLDALASLRGIGRTDELPLHSDDAELIPNRSGGVTMRVNPDRPETRQRFSIAHEISHTFLPGYAAKAWCRTDARYRDRSNPDDYIEMLCDIGAAELLFPHQWFAPDAALVHDAAGLTRLASTYCASREATTRRFAEMSADTVAAVFFSWKLKPTQRGRIGCDGQPSLFGSAPQEELRDAIRLRIEYVVPSQSFKSAGYFLPKDKSVAMDSPICRVGSTGIPTDDECFLNLGQAAATYRLSALPLWTAEDDQGPNKENAVVALLWPVSIQQANRRSKNSINATLFS